MAKYAQTEMITTRSSRKVAMHIHAKLVLYCAYNTLEQLDLNYGSALCAESIRNTRRPPLCAPESLETKRRLTHSSESYIGMTPKNSTYAMSIQRSSCVTRSRSGNQIAEKGKITLNYFNWCFVSETCN